ncbi:hypothetical protein V9T40_003224 [Parthenolecanium corni]|uniref:NADP-dependent oxidoreductase domain-containing protein n=1 Tax=Parthenolecanium corni TaxID=536013 RepID=A0AAN9TQ99_9HEMI
MAVSKLKLNNGFEIPAFGLGTYAGKEIKDVIKLSIDLGYRLIDTAFVYANEKEIGEGIAEKIKDGTVKREDLFIVTKLWNTRHKPEDVVPAMKRSLSSLGLDYVDLYLMHWPFATELPTDEFKIFENIAEEDIPFEDTWKEMEKCVKLGYTRSIGLSNFNSVQVDRILKISEIKPVVNQVECNPYLSQEKLKQFCQERGILLMAYSPFYAPSREIPSDKDLNLFEEPLIKEIAGKYEKTTGQVILRYLTQSGVIPIPKSDNPERLKQNISIFDFTLTAEDFEKMRSINKNIRCTQYEA